MRITQREVSAFILGVLVGLVIVGLLIYANA